MSEGYAFVDKDSGVLYIGEDIDANRIRQIQLGSGSGGNVKLFKDGGFQIASVDSSTLGDSIVSKSAHGLKIHSKGDLNIQSEGTLTIKARQIKFESTSSERDFVIRNDNGNIRIESSGNVGIKGNNVVVSATRNAVVKSEGNVYLVASGGQIFNVEPLNSLIPSGILDVVTKVTQFLNGW